MRVARIDGELIAFSNADQLDESELDLIISGSEHSILMIEGFAQELPENEMVDAIVYGHNVVREIIGLMRQLADRVGVKKMEFVPPSDNGLFDRLCSAYYDQFRVAKTTEGKQARADAVRALKEKAWSELCPDPANPSVDPNQFATVWHDLQEKVVRDLIMGGTRPDGRDRTSLRAIECETDVLPRTHGSAIFQRGETQSLITVALGTARDEQRVDGLVEEYSKKFMLDYNFPSFSVGECRPIRGRDDVKLVTAHWPNAAWLPCCLITKNSLHHSRHQ